MERPTVAGEEASSQRRAATRAAAAEVDSGRFTAELARRVAFATESERADSLPVLRRYLGDEIGPALAALGLSSRIVEPHGARHPFLLAERFESAARPTVLSYGHGDVTLGDGARWSAGRSPFALTAADGRWYGRGAADNKGQHTINLAALRAVLQTRGRLGFNLRVLFEMGEEVGSPGLRELCAAERDSLAADVLIASDGSRAALDRPTLVLGTRGGVTFELRLDRRERPLHPGSHGGVAANPAVELANAIACLVDGRGRIRARALVPERVPPAVSALLARMGEIEVEASDPGWGEPGLSGQERLQAWSSLDVLAMTAGTPEAPGNAIPPSAWARCQLRFPVEIDKAAVVPAVAQHLAAHGFHGIEVRPAGIEPFGATRTDPACPWAGWAERSLARTLSRPPTVMVGGSAPSDVLEECLGMPALWLPHGYPGAGQHAPDEHLPVALARQALALMAGLFFDLGEDGPDGPPAALSA